MAADAQKVIVTAGVISVGVGSANAVLKQNRLPSGRFLIGSGLAYFLLSAIAEGEPEVAKALALAVMTTVLLGEGGGLLAYLDTGEMDTRPKSQSHTPTSPHAPATPAGTASASATSGPTPLPASPQLRAVPFHHDTIHLPGFTPAN